MSTLIPTLPVLLDSSLDSAHGYLSLTPMPMYPLSHSKCQFSHLLCPEPCSPSPPPPPLTPVFPWLSPPSDPSTSMHQIPTNKLHHGVKPSTQVPLGILSTTIGKKGQREEGKKEESDTFRGGGREKEGDRGVQEGEREGP